MAPECKHNRIPIFSASLTTGSYNGTSDLQLERMNVYFNEVCRRSWSAGGLPNLLGRRLATNMFLVLSSWTSNPVPWTRFVLVRSASFSVLITSSSARAVLVRARSAPRAPKIIITFIQVTTGPRVTTPRAPNWSTKFSMSSVVKPRAATAFRASRSHTPSAVVRVRAWVRS